MDRSRLASLRVDYEARGLRRADMASDPAEEFLIWFEEAETAGVVQVNAFILATADEQGSPSARAVLAKEIDQDGIVFYTNMTSRKGGEIAVNPRAAATFLWLDLHRQVRIEGPVTQVSAETSDEYFATRPPGARIAAAASPQSEVVPDRETLDRRFAELLKEYPDGEILRPLEWGGYRLGWEVVEFWQGRPNRFHDRVRYRREDGEWVKERLAP